MRCAISSMSAGSWPRLPPHGARAAVRMRAPMRRRWSNEKGPQLSLRALSSGSTPSGLGKRHAHLALVLAATVAVADLADIVGIALEEQQDRKSTRLNSSHLVISYAVFCLKKQTKLP